MWMEKQPLQKKKKKCMKCAIEAVLFSRIDDALLPTLFCNELHYVHTTAVIGLTKVISSSVYLTILPCSPYTLLYIFMKDIGAYLYIAHSFSISNLNKKQTCQNLLVNLQKAFIFQIEKKMTHNRYIVHYFCWYVS